MTTTVPKVLVGMTAAAVLALQSWEAGKINEYGNQLASLSAKMDAAGADRYHAAQAVEDFHLRDSRIDGIERRVERLEGRRR